MKEYIAPNIFLAMVYLNTIPNLTSRKFKLEDYSFEVDELLTAFKTSLRYQENFSSKLKFNKALIYFDDFYNLLTSYKPIKIKIIEDSSKSFTDIIHFDISVDLETDRRYIRDFKYVDYNELSLYYNILVNKEKYIVYLNVINNE